MAFISIFEACKLELSALILKIFKTKFLPDCKIEFKLLKNPSSVEFIFKFSFVAIIPYELSIFFEVIFISFKACMFPDIFYKLSVFISTLFACKFILFISILSFEFKFIFPSGLNTLELFNFTAYIGVFGQQCRSCTGHFCNEIF